MKIELIKGDITKVECDAIVNAANRALSGGGGVDGAIHAVAGPELLDACRLIGPCETGHAKITAGFNLPATYVIHAVGPVWYGGDRNEANLLASCYRESLKLAQQNKIKTIAFPASSCGAYRYPLQEAAQITIATLSAFLEKNNTIEEITLALFDKRTYQAYLRAVQAHSKTR